MHNKIASVETRFKCLGNALLQALVNRGTVKFANLWSPPAKWCASLYTKTNLVL